LIETRYVGEKYDWMTGSKVIQKVLAHSRFMHQRPAVPDFPHGPAHPAMTVVFTAALCEAMRLPIPIREAAACAAILHDEGYVEAAQGKISYSDHHKVSFERANEICRRLGLNKQMTHDITEAIRLHVSDVLPIGAPLVAGVLLAADRAAGWGWAGIFRDAYYWGFRHPAFEDPEVWSLMRPVQEQQLRDNCLEELTGFLVNNDHIERLTARTLIQMYRFKGLKNPDGTWAIQPILPIAQREFLSRIMTYIRYNNYVYMVPQAEAILGRRLY
jgi:hypothetical protein